MTSWQLVLRIISLYSPWYSPASSRDESSPHLHGGRSMPRTRWIALAVACLLAAGSFSLRAADDKPPEGFTPLFNGKNLAGWKVPQGDNGHWKVAGGVIDYDAKSEAKGDKNLWTEKAYKDFILRIDWRL